MSESRETALAAEVDRLKLELQTLKASDNSGQIFVGNYLLARLTQLNVTHMFGVPGDFNLGFLDLVEDHPTISWAGNCNELNAAYAADGYARVKLDSIGVVLTTFGVGELSACNGIAGAFSEMVPVLHIAGVPSTAQQKAKPMLHHTLGDGRYDAYSKAAEQFTISQAYLNNKETAAAEIDRVLTDCLLKARPVYLTLPTDLAYEKISSERLKIPLSRIAPPNDPETEAFVVDEIVKLVDQAEGNVVILVDACALRHGTKEEVTDLVYKTHFPVYSAPMGKGTIDESYDRYGGIYIGSLSHPNIKEKVESAKLILSVGSLKSDFNSGNFTYSIPTSRTVELHSGHTQIRYATYQGIGMKQLLPKLTARFHPYKETALKLQVPSYKAPIPTSESSSTDAEHNIDAAKENLNENIISHAWFWPRMGKFFKPKDVIVAETGTSNFGILDIPFPEHAVFVSQILWGSIGWTVGSTLGAALAAKDVGLGRTILFIGDGSMQLTVQELSTMMHWDLCPIIFLLNNSGYTIERYLHGRERHYNDIVNWKWTSLLSVLGDHDGRKSKSYTVNNRAELDALLDNTEFADAGKIQLVEVMMDKFDAPRALQSQAVLSNKTNKYVVE